MAKRAKKTRSVDGDAGKRRMAGDEKIARLLALLLVKGIDNKTDQVALLRRAGFDVSEVASLLSMTENHVMVADHNARKKIARPRRSATD